MANQEKPTLWFLASADFLRSIVGSLRDPRLNPTGLGIVYPNFHGGLVLTVGVNDDRQLNLWFPESSFLDFSAGAWDEEEFVIDLNEFWGILGGLKGRVTCRHQPMIRQCSVEAVESGGESLFSFPVYKKTGEKKFHLLGPYFDDTGECSAILDHFTSNLPNVRYSDITQFLDLPNSSYQLRHDGQLVGVAKVTSNQDVLDDIKAEAFLDDICASWSAAAPTTPRINAGFFYEIPIFVDHVLQPEMAASSLTMSTYDGLTVKFSAENDIFDTFVGTLGENEVFKIDVYIEDEDSDGDWKW